MTYTFNLRHGVMFHNGRELTAADIKYAIERVANPATQSPGAGFFTASSGAITCRTAVDDLSVFHTPDDPHRRDPDVATDRHDACKSSPSISPSPCRGRSRGVGEDFSHHAGRHRRLHDEPMEARPAHRVEAQPGLLQDGVPYLDQITFQVGRRADDRACSRCRTAKPTPRRRHSARQVPGGDRTIRPMKDLIVEGEPAADRLCDDERQHAAVRQCGGASGRQHGDQQGSHRPDHQQPRRTGEPAAAADDARLRSELRRATPTIRKGRRRCWPRPASPTGSTTELYVDERRSEPAHRAGDPAGSREDRHQGEAEDRWRRRT